MVLAIDIGNSNIVLGGLEGDEIVFQARMATDLTRTADQYCAELKSMLSLYEVSPRSLEGAILSSVVPPVSNAIVSAVERLTGHRPMTVGPGLKTGVKICIDNPAQAGADLIVGAAAVLSEYGAPACIIDLGTATTMTVLNGEGCFVGGTIHPGVKLSLNALTSRAAQLPGISLEPPRKVIGTNTVECMRGGMIVGTACMIDGMIDRFEAELGCRIPVVVATGGLAKYIVPLCRREIVLDDDLLLKGLRVLYRRNVR